MKERDSSVPKSSLDIKSYKDRTFSPSANEGQLKQIERVSKHEPNDRFRNNLVRTMEFDNYQLCLARASGYIKD